LAAKVRHFLTNGGSRLQRCTLNRILKNVCPRKKVQVSERAVNICAASGGPGPVLNKNRGQGRAEARIFFVGENIGPVLFFLDKRHSSAQL
jgi:hypothetical protein